MAKFGVKQQSAHDWLTRNIIAQHRRSGTGGGSGVNKAWRAKKAAMDKHAHPVGTAIHNFLAIGWGDYAAVEKTPWAKHISARARANEKRGGMLQGLSWKPRKRYGVRGE